MYYLYILQCADKTLYTGITTHVDRRMKEHNTSKLGAKYTRARRPVQLVYSKRFVNRSEAQKEESRIKELSREEKLQLLIVRSKRRSVALMISPDATLTVRAPFATTLEYIKKLVFEKRDWIRKKRMQIVQHGGPPKPKEFTDGEEFLYLGEPHRLQFANGKGLCLKDRRTKVMEWYKRQAMPHITARADAYRRITGWNFTSLAITKAESRWGSCGPKGSINFSWKLMMAPPEVIDYVVVHELAHITEKNHSKRFWNKVGSVLPDYKERRRWLRENVAKCTI